MTITSPVILLLCLPLIGFVVWRSRRIKSGVIARWSLRGAMIALLLAAAGIDLRCDRDARIAVMIDVSPSTRAATFRNAKAVDARLRPLLHGRSFETIYFADGVQASSQESSAMRTQLVPPIADAVLLLSDGQFEAPATMPPTFAIVDPALDAPADAQVTEIEQRGGQLAVSTRVTGEPRTLRISDASPNQLAIAAGDRVTLVQTRARETIARFTPDPVDAWPENDSLRYRVASSQATEQWAIGASVNGFRAIAADALPTESADYLAPSVIVVDTRQSLDPAAADRLVQYVRDLGGTLVLAGPAGALTDPLRALAPLGARPPEPERQWVLLLDASGSMDARSADGRSRWGTAVDAARVALRHLPEEARVSLAVFNRTVQWIARGESPAQIGTRIDALSKFAPTGPTGLAAALEAIASESLASARLLVITDGDATIDSAGALAGRLTSQRIQLLALLTTGGENTKPIVDLARATGGAAITEDNTDRWGGAAAALAQQGLGEIIDNSPATAPGTGAISGLGIRYTACWTAWPRVDAEVIARSPAGDHAIVAMRQAGTGRVVSIVADANSEDLAHLATRLRQPPADPRFAVTWDEHHDRVTLTAHDRRGPMNELRPSLVRGEDEVVAFEQTSPGEYAAILLRRADPTLATVRVGGQIVARRAIAGRYANEFDATGNDRRALQALAERTGGRVIEAGDRTPIYFPAATDWRSTRPALSAISVVGLLVAIVFLRAPYLEDRAMHALGQWRAQWIKKRARKMPAPR